MDLLTDLQEQHREAVFEICERIETLEVMLSEIKLWTVQKTSMRAVAGTFVASAVYLGGSLEKISTIRETLRKHKGLTEKCWVKCT